MTEPLETEATFEVEPIDFATDNLRESDDYTARMFLLVNGSRVAHRDICYQDATVPEPCSWGGLLGAQAALEERIAAELMAEYAASSEHRMSTGDMAAFDPSWIMALQSDDLVKTDLELTCTRCATILCDVEHGDHFQILLSVVAGHRCER